MGHVLLEKFHGFDRCHVGELVAKNERAAEEVLGNKQVVAAGGRGNKVDGRIETFVGHFAVELQLHVAGAFEFLEDDVVHFAACFGKGGGDDGQ